ncbi:MAG TPA: hypothetical protein PKE46_10515 [Micropruina sp.]|nr:hypothetical protein [Micropruina sp.]HMR22559.1 hypothetical protein [Micropruina sp.]
MDEAVETALTAYWADAAPAHSWAQLAASPLTEVVERQRRRMRSALYAAAAELATEPELNRAQPGEALELAGARRAEP